MTLGASGSRRDRLLQYRGQEQEKKGFSWGSIVVYKRSTDSYFVSATAINHRSSPITEEREICYLASHVVNMCDCRKIWLNSWQQLRARQGGEVSSLVWGTV